MVGVFGGILKAAVLEASTVCSGTLASCIAVALLESLRLNTQSHSEIIAPDWSSLVPASHVR